MVSAIEKMYTALKVILKIGNKISYIDQTIGVRQGDPMSPVLFLFLMTAFAETLDSVWDEANIPRAEFHHTPLDNLENGQLISHPTNSFNRGDIYNII